MNPRDYEIKFITGEGEMKKTNLPFVSLRLLPMLLLKNTPRSLPEPGKIFSFI